MLHTLAFATMLAAATAAPATYDQRQDGDFNVRADVQNVILVIAYPDKMKLPTDIFGGLKSNKHDAFQERADVRVMEAFIEPSSPYRVNIGADSERYADTDGRSVVVLDGKRRLDAEPQEAEPQEAELQETKPQEDQPQGAKPQAPEPLEAETQEAEVESVEEEFKLVGAREQCGPGRERDRKTLACRVVAPAVPQPAAQLEQAAAQSEVPVAKPEVPAAKSEPTVVQVS